MNSPGTDKNRRRSILVIDDSKLTRTVVNNILSRLNMEVVEAGDGIEGLDLLEKRRFDLILVDIIMPKLDGFGFLERFKKKGNMDFTPVILMTGTEDLNAKIKGLSIGADDYLMKPLNENELAARVQSLLRLKSMHDDLYQKDLLIRKELDIARRIQQFIIPREFTGIQYPSINGRYIPIEDIGGDFFDCYSLGDDTGILIADVTGHGIPAAMVMTMSKLIFGLYAAQIDSPGVLLSRINTEIYKLILDDQYITAFYLIYDAERKELRFSNAGHARPLYFRKKTGRILALDTDGLFVGILENSEYEEKTLPVQEGDRLLLYTDGITELKNSQREQFGEKRLAQFIIKHSETDGNEFCDALLAEIKAFAGEENADDDIAFLDIKF